MTKYRCIEQKIERTNIKLPLAPKLIKLILHSFVLTSAQSYVPIVSHQDVRSRSFSSVEFAYHLIASHSQQGEGAYKGSAFSCVTFDAREDTYLIMSNLRSRVAAIFGLMK